MSAPLLADTEAFFAAVGRLTISWAHLEFGVDRIVDTVYHAHGGRHIVREMPRAFKKKIEFLRVALKKLDRLKPQRQTIRMFLDAASVAAERRNDLIHGAVIDHDLTNRDVIVTMVRLMREPHGGHWTEPKRFSTETIAADAATVSQLAYDAFQVAGLIASLPSDLM